MYLSGIFLFLSAYFSYLPQISQVTQIFISSFFKH